MIHLRPEQPDDLDAVEELLTVAFAFDEHSRLDEPRIVSELRQAGVLSVALVAESTERNEIVGFIAFSPVTISDGTPDWYALGPIAVDPRLQRHGIGRRLMEEGLADLRGLGARGCVVVADPPFYQQFHFRHPEHLEVQGARMDSFLIQVFEGGEPEGTVVYHPAFEAEDLQA